MLPTKHGLLFAVVLLVIFLASINYNNGLAYGFTFLLASTALVSMLHTHRNLSGLEIKILPGNPVFAGEHAHFRVALHNAGDYYRTGIWIFCGDFCQNFHVEPGVTLQLEVPVATHGRGYMSCAPLRFSSAYPLGLQYTWSAAVASEVKCLVYPAAAGELALPVDRTRARFSESGQTLDGDDFAELREYAPGDPPGHIHWKALAAHQVMLTKRFAGEGTEEVWLDWDDTVGGTERRLSQLSKWVVLAEASTIRYGLTLPGSKLNPDRGLSHYHSCLKCLALWGAAN